MTYWLLTLILANGGQVHLWAYGSPQLCKRAAHGAVHTCTRVTYEEYR